MNTKVFQFAMKFEQTEVESQGLLKAAVVAVLELRSISAGEDG